MSFNTNQKAKVRGPRQNLRKRNGSARRSSAIDQALQLRPEYKGQPVVSHTFRQCSVSQSTTVTTGQIAYNTAISAALIPSFAARFIGYEEFRITRFKAKVMNYSSTNPGVISHWVSSDDSTAPTLVKSQNLNVDRFNASDVTKSHNINYVPHDPSEQGWSLVSAAAGPIGYYKLYTDSALGASIVATPYLDIEFEIVVQFRGFI